MRVLRQATAWGALGVVVLAPAAGGCQAPWAWGFLLAAVCLCAVLTLLADEFLPRVERGTEDLLAPPLRGVAWTGLAALAWLSLLCLYDHAAGPGGGRLPALSGRVLLHAWAFAAAFVTGLHWGGAGRRLRRALGVILLAGVCYAGLAILEWAGLGPRQVFGWTVDLERPSGFYTNANRYAVLLALCCGGGVALAAAVSFGLRPPRSRQHRLRYLLGVALLVAGALGVAAGLALTLSRATIFTASLAAGIAVAGAILKAHRAAAEEEERAAGRSSRGVSRAGRLKLGLLLLALAVPVLVFWAGALTVAGHRLVSRVKNLTRSELPETNARYRVMRVGWGLLCEEPLRGQGLGSFEQVFRPRQPLDLVLRWDHSHDDWLELGIEAGFPALALTLLAAAAFAALAWRGCRWRRGGSHFLILWIGGLTLAVPLAVSLVDFPLREPANAMLFFFLAGAFAAAWHRTARRAQCGTAAPGCAPHAALAAGAAVPQTALLHVLRGILVVVFLVVAFCAGRIAWATAQSPWLGHILAPPPRPAQVAGYRRALSVSPRDPALLYPYCLALVEALRASSPPDREAVAAELAGALAEMDQVNPRDFRRPWLEGQADMITGNGPRAVEAFERAVALAPAYREWRLQAAKLRLYYLFRPERPFTPGRAAQLQIVSGHFRQLLKFEPTLEDGLVAALEENGALPIEVVELWPLDEPGPVFARAVFARARYWLHLGNWNLAAVELDRLPPESAADPWAQALRGGADFGKADLAAGVTHWRAALAGLSSQKSPGLERWMAIAPTRLPSDAAMAAAEGLGEEVSQVPSMAVNLAWRLVNENHMAAGDRLLALAAERHPDPEVYRWWAELAGVQKNYAAARSRGLRAWELSNHSSEWNRWLDERQAQWRKAERAPR